MMRKPAYLLIFIFILLGACVNEDPREDILETKEELTVFDKNGQPVAYCNYSNKNETVIYLWNGKPTAYFDTKKDELIYGFNGKFLGWRESGIYYDLQGKRIGFEENALSMVTTMEPIKYIKEMLPAKSVKETPPAQPAFSAHWSTTKLDSFLLKGRE